MALTMLMVILGAGASYDSTPRHTPGMGITANGMSFEPRPPMADGLFETRFKKAMERFPECIPLVPLLRTSVEERLQRLLVEAEEEESLTCRQQIMAIRHYLHQIIGDCEEGWIQAHGGITNHVALVGRISRWCNRFKKGACFVTFNYDTLIERAFLHAPLNIRMQELDEYISHETYKVIKLHGSITWFHEVRLPALLGVQERDYDNIVRELIARAPEVKLAAEFLVRAWKTSGRDGDDGPVVIPAIAIPVQKKLEFECPGEHLETLRTCLPLVTKLLVVGWQAKEDEFIGLLKRGLPPSVETMVVGKDEADARTITERLQGFGIPGSFRQSTARGFSRFIEDWAVDEFLFP